ncbi:hypothetical protein M5103_001973 [Vibrio alginolyticus]|uniref:hypothetical protein n=1 Tax=Vibrio alginolyticus TaxID=663 RepID=UPI001BD1BDF3|nr:hypothetical protein [Vibrio alginolyticus]EJE8154280.1 hypothetical protein [Vibrio alginolyticus]MBS9975567.1 hypothetical protein [Vibrio alginolyticus]MBT0021385.1 hypothetical protein [Vibrio alginolyticus]
MSDQENDIRVTLVEEKKKDFSFLKQLLLLILGSFVFVVVAEGYKSDLGRNKDLVKEYYRPVKVAMSNCLSPHNQLFLKHAELGGSYQLVFDELVFMFNNQGIANSHAYQEFPTALLKSNNSVKKEIESLKTNIESCRVKVYQAYEELALVTGKFDSYQKLYSEHIDTLKDLNNKLKDNIPAEIKTFDVKEVVPMMREYLTLDLSKNENQELLMQRIEIMSRAVIKMEMNKAEVEQSKFNENKRFHDALMKIFLEEINRRNSPSIVSQFLK